MVGDPMTHDDLHAIWEWASEEAHATLHPVQQRAWSDFAWACCVLDAVLARTERGLAREAD